MHHFPVLNDAVNKAVQTYGAWSACTLLYCERDLPHMVIIKASAEVKEQTANYQRQHLHLAWQLAI